MKRITAFAMAFVLFLATVFGIHVHSVKSISLNNNAFSTWSNKAKFNSPDAIRANLNDGSIVVFGSSEFQHGQNTPYHPKAVFDGFEFNPMLIGAGFYQCLQHAITLASIGDEVKTSKVVLLLSPTWFRKNGVVDTAFASRFSESSYLGMLKNEQISDQTKEYMIQRTEKLLEVDQGTRSRVEVYNRVLLNQKPSLMDQLNYHTYQSFLSEKEHQGVVLQAKMAKIKPNQNKGNADKEIDWETYSMKAQAQSEKNNNNPFYMTPKGFAKIAYRYDGQRSEVKPVKDCYAKSLEYDDLRCFLDICKEMDIEPLLVALPVNGYWFEYTGFPPETRVQYYKNIQNIAKEYQVQLADLSGEEFSKYFFEDGVHLAGKGWVRVNEVLYSFYNQDKE